MKPSLRRKPAPAVKPEQTSQPGHLLSPAKAQPVAQPESILANTNKLPSPRWSMPDKPVAVEKPKAKQAPASSLNATVVAELERLRAESK